MGLAGLTAVFGMGTGGAPPVSSPEMRAAGRQAAPAAGVFSAIAAVGHASLDERVVGDQSPTNAVPIVTGVLGISDRFTPAIGPGRPWRGEGNGSGWSSSRLLGPVGCGARAPYTSGLSTWSSSRSLLRLREWKPRLGGGFALRCLQRLSGPDLATRRCPERDSRHTRGRSSPILSY